MEITKKINNENCIFFDVDTQHDYLSANSSKSIKNSADIRKNLLKLTVYAVENNIKIIGSVDVHHNTTQLRNKIQETFVQGTIFVPNIKVSEQIISKALQTNLPVLVEKQAYSCFQNPNMDVIVKKIIEKNINQAVVYGVATEYCVKEAVLGLLSRGIKVLLVRDAIGAINHALGEEALKEMKEAGAALIEAEEFANPIKIINA